jgi:hypothetical protein
MRFLSGAAPELSAPAATDTSIAEHHLRMKAFDARGALLSLAPCGGGLPGVGLYRAPAPPRDRVSVVEMSGVEAAAPVDVDGLDGSAQAVEDPGVALVAAADDTGTSERNHIERTARRPERRLLP